MAIGIQQTDDFVPDRDRGQEEALIAGDARDLECVPARQAVVLKASMPDRVAGFKDMVDDVLGGGETPGSGRTG